MASQPKQRRYDPVRFRIDEDTEFLLLDERLAEALVQAGLINSLRQIVYSAICQARQFREQGRVDGDGDVVLDLWFEWETDLPRNYLLTLRANDTVVIAPLPRTPAHLSCPLA